MALLIIVAKLSIVHVFVEVLATTLETVQHEQSATGKKFNMLRVQLEENANRKHCNV